MAPAVDTPELIVAWLHARSVVRGLPAPIRDHGGWRVDTNLPDERRRYVFTNVCDGLCTLGAEITEPLQLLKLAASPNVLMALLPARWTLRPLSYVMATNGIMAPAVAPAGYHLELGGSDGFWSARATTDAGDLAASGHAAERGGVFIYDRIVTHAAHQRRGLGRAVMAALASRRCSVQSQQILTATPQGRDLYLQLGWRVVSDWSTAAID